MKPQTKGVALPNPWDQPTLSIEESADLLGVGRAAAYRSAKTGALPTIPVGSTRHRVPTAALYRLLGLPLPEKVA